VGRAWKIGSVGGVAIRVDSSWVFIAILITYSLWLRYSTPFHGLSNSTALWLAVFGGVLFFGSVLIHELAHAGMARARGIAVSGITLFLFGGATTARVEEKGPGSEFLVTAVGPGASFGLAAVFWALSKSVGTPVFYVLDDLARTNFILAVFNLVPGFPLDGGRILRSGIWRATGDLDRATRIAGTAGVVVGYGFVAAGVIEFVSGQDPAALWLALIGWFLLQAARGSMRYQRVQRALARGMVRDAMGPPPAVIPAELSLTESLDRYLRGHEDETFPVVEGGEVVGLLTFEAARRVGQHEPFRPVRDAMLPPSGAMTVRLDEPLDSVSERLEGRAAMVLDDHRLVGTLSPADLSRWLGRHGRFRS
jgi:Zn-dependent protease